MFLIEDAIIKTGKITPPVTCDYSLQLLAAWVTVHTRFLPHHKRISFQNEALALSGYDLVYTGSWFSSVLMLQTGIIAVTLRWLLSTHLHFCPYSALWQLFKWLMLKQIMEVVKLKKNTEEKIPFSTASVPGSDFPYSSVKLCKLNREGTSGNEQQEDLLKEDLCNNCQG